MRGVGREENEHKGELELERESGRKGNISMMEKNNKNVPFIT